MLGGAAPLNWAATRRWLSTRWPIGEAAALACCLEASAPKAGNVTPATAFSDMDFSDFLVSGLSICQSFNAAHSHSVGEIVLSAVSATRSRLDVNTNLGTILLLAPLAKALVNLDQTSEMCPSWHKLHTAVQATLNALDARDAEQVYAAIRLAKPGGLGRVAEHDVNSAPPNDLRQAMAAAASVDAVAAQYVNGFEDVFDKLVPWLRAGLARGLDLRQSITEVQLRWLATETDGLIVRKVGTQVADEARQLAAIALEEWLETDQCGVRWHALDTFLRADGHARNPGTSADLIAAAIFVLLTANA